MPTSGSEKRISGRSPFRVKGERELSQSRKEIKGNPLGMAQASLYQQTSQFVYNNSSGGFQRFGIWRLGAEYAHVWQN
jgi:hypothetical protein